MDAFTHVLVGYGLGLVLFRDARLAAATALGALAPDLDVLLTPLTLLDPLYFLQHRGATHSLVGAPLWALLVAGAVDRLARRWKPLRPLRWQRRTPYAVVAGAWSQLLLDAPTHQGIPWLWPLMDSSYSPEIFFWMIIWLAPFSFAVLLWRYRGKISDRAVQQATAGIVLAILLVGGVRLVQQPAGDHVFSTNNPYVWHVAQDHGNGSWSVDVIVRGDSVQRTWYADDVPEAARPALAALQETVAYRSFAMGSFPITVTHAEPVPGGWRFNVTDVVLDMEMRNAPDWLPRRAVEERGRFEATVTAEGVHVHLPRW